MKILVTGAAGMLGSRVCKALANKQHWVVGADMSQADINLDICDMLQVREVFREHRPEVVVHCAAMTDVDRCTHEPDRAFRVNALGTANIASASADCEAAMVHISTDYVFSGNSDQPYTEFDTPCPVNIYGASKLLAENYVRDICQKFYIIRTSWLFAPTHINFPLRILQLASEGKKLKIVDDQVGSPTYAQDLADFVARTLFSESYGTYHFTNAGSCSWYQFACKLIELAGMSDIEITPIKSEDWPTDTVRPKYSVLRRYRLELAGKDNCRTWEETAAEFVREWTTAKQ